MRRRGQAFANIRSIIVVTAAIVFPALLFADTSGALPAALFKQSVQPDQLIPADLTPSREELVNSQLKLVTDLENQFGPYDIKLKEALKGLGFQLQKAGDLAAASEAYKRALHISRVNEGLNNESQLSIVERLIGVNQQMARWEQVNNHYGYLEHLYKKLYRKDDPRLEEGLRKVVAWHFDASNFNLNGRRVDHLRKAHGLLKLRLEVAELTLSGEDPLLDSLKRNIAQSEYYLYLSSDLYQEMSRQRRRYSRDRYLANLD
ncbi:MAG: hypothetical protein KJN90_14980 [Gammaproteobacteria bacterium]|nr:hypothetical protein [Gammaproteobacteria bacterium]